jgi:TIR domain
MAEHARTCDVLISHSARDSALALELADACRESGLVAITDTELLPEANSSDALWEALAESRALLMILSHSGLTTSMGIEIGAARAWNKPIYAVVTDPTMTRLPSSLAGIDLYTTGKIQDVIRAVKSDSQPLTDEDRAALTRLYSGMDISVDQLAFDPTKRRHLVNSFRRGQGKIVSEERLLSELLRLRKQGKLVRGRSAERLVSTGEPG